MSFLSAQPLSANVKGEKEVQEEEEKSRLQFQPVVNIGLCGHVSHGKTSLIRCITGEHTSRGDSRAVKNNITIQVGYSNAKIFQCSWCEPPACFASCEGSSKKIPPCPSCEETGSMTLVSHISFVDCPGHHALMRNMISGSAVMDGVLLVIAANDPCPMAQTAEHLVAADICGIEKYVVLQNKVDLIVSKSSSIAESRKELEDGKKSIEEFVGGTSAQGAPIVPVSFSPARSLNVDVVLQYLVAKFKQTELAQECYRPFPLVMHCVRSFNINKPGCEISIDPKGKIECSLKGGVIGGTIMNGVIKVGDEIEIRPGLLKQDSKTGQFTATPLRTRVVGLMTGTTKLEEASRGGLIAVQTTLDPTLTRSDRMVGMVIGRVSSLPDAVQSLVVKIKLLRWALGMAEEGAGDDETRKKKQALKREKVEALQKGEILQLSVGSGSERAKVGEQKEKNLFLFHLAKPVCAIPGQKMTISRKIDGSFRIIGQAVSSQ